MGGMPRCPGPYRSPCIMPPPGLRSLLRWRSCFAFLPGCTSSSLTAGAFNFSLRVRRPRPPFSLSPLPSLASALSLSPPFLSFFLSSCSCLPPLEPLSLPAVFFSPASFVSVYSVALGSSPFMGGLYTLGPRRLFLPPSRSFSRSFFSLGRV